MEACLLDLAKNEAPSLVNLVKNQAQFLCCFNNYVEEFDHKKEILAAKLDDMKKEIKKARGVLNFKSEALQWEDETENIINIDTKRKKKCFFGLCVNCWWQYSKGKELAEKTQQIEELLGRSNSNIVAGRANSPGIKYISSESFITFKSRELKLQYLMKALEEDDCNIIGLQGMWGTGKTSMAKEVGGKLLGPKFDKVIFLVVSQAPDLKKIRGEIARELDLTLEEGKEEEHSKEIWSKITNMEEKLLIILDGVWEAFDLTEGLGIPSSHQHKGCSVLITTRNSHICTTMRCQQTIQLEKLTNEEAFNLFLAHASINNSSRDLKGVAQKIVKQCGGVPVVIVERAKALNNRPPLVWKNALKTLENGDMNKNLEEAFKCPKLSYDNLKKEAKDLFLISSLFPKGFDIPMELLSKIGIGLGLFGRADKYHNARSEALYAIMEIIDSTLLLNVKGECVKMQDLVHNMALWIGDSYTQSIMDLKESIKKDLQYLYWKNDDFPAEFDGTRLELLLMFLDSSKDLKVPNTFFKEVKKLKVLILGSSDDSYQISAPSLLYSLQSLKDIRTLILRNLKLGDISIIGNLQSLETLWLHCCSIIELPIEFLKLLKLRLLEVEECKIERNNPFKVIERCSQLEELTFVQNKYDKGGSDAISQNVFPLTLDRYQISSQDLSDYFEKYRSLSRCFRLEDLRNLVSEATFMQLVAKAELLILGGYKKTRWKYLFPDIVSMEDESMDNLIILHLYSWPGIQCLVNTKNHHVNVTAFSKLVELHLSEMDVEYICCGSPPSGFLEQLEVMKLNKCQKLRNILSDGKLKLHDLKTMELEECPLLTSIFQPSTARSLKQLEELIIRNCNELEYIISDVSFGGEIVNDDGDDQKSYDSLFPNLKTLQIAGCGRLKIILPVIFAGDLKSLEEISICDCQRLEYIFVKYQEEDRVMLPTLKEIELCGVPNLIRIYREPISLSIQRPSSLVSRDKSKEKLPSLDAHASTWAQLCCFLHKSRTTIEETNVAASKDRLLKDHTIPISGSLVSKKWFVTADILLKQLLNFRHVKKMNFGNLSLNSASLFTLSIASMILWEELTIRECVGLKSIITSDADNYNDRNNYISIFPKLQELEIRNCNDLEFLFLSTKSVRIEHLKSLIIKDAPMLYYVAGRYPHEDHLSIQNQNDALQFQLPALKVLCLQDVPRSIVKYFTDLMACLDERQLNQKTTEEIHGVPPPQAAQSPMTQSLSNIKEMELFNCSNLKSFLTLSVASAIWLEKLTIRECDKLKCIVGDEGNAQVPTNNCSIFPKLNNLEISGCKDLEFLFPFTLSGGLESLTALTIINVPKLKYVVGKYQQEQHFSYDVLHFYLPALEVLCIKEAQGISSICAKNYKLVLSLSLQTVILEDCSIKSLTDLTVRSDEKELNASVNAVHPFQAAQRLSIQSLNNIKEITLLNCSNLTSMVTLSTASMILLEKLTIRSCDQLKFIVADKGDDGAQSNHNSIFPKLKELDILECDALEYLFPASVFESYMHLISLKICNAPMLKYVFGSSYYENQDNQTYIDFHALEHLRLWDVPNLVSIYPKNYNLRGPSLKSIALNTSPEFTVRSITDLTVCWHASQQDSTITEVIETHLQALTSLNVCNSKIEQIFSLMHLDVKKNWKGHKPLTSSLSSMSLENLSELSNICVGPRCILSFNSLTYLKISACKGLKVIFTISTLKGLPKLEILQISKCKELIRIVGEENADDHMCYESCFPMLYELSIGCCDRLKYIFSITVSGILPELRRLYISESSDLKRVLDRQDETKEMVMNDVFPKLSVLRFENLPSIKSVCYGIDFQTLEEHALVNACPEFSYYETTATQLQVGPENIDLEAQQKMKEKISSDQSDMGEIKERQDMATQQSTIGSPSFSKAVKDTLKEIVEDGDISEMPRTTISPEPKFIGEHDEVVGIEVKSERIMKDPQQSTVSTPNLTKDKLDGKEEKNEIIMMDLKQSPFGTQNLTKVELVGSEVKKETIMMDPQSPQETGHDIRSIYLENIIEARPKEGVSSETLHSSTLTSKMKVSILMSPNLAVLPAGDNNPLVTKILEEEEEEEGGLITIPRKQRDIKTESYLPKEKSTTSVHGHPMWLEGSVSLKQTPLSTSSKPTYGRNIQSGVITAKQQTHDEVVDTFETSGKSGALAMVLSGGGDVVPIPHATMLFKPVRNETEENTASHGGQAILSDDIRVDPGPPTQMGEESSCSGAKIAEHHDVMELDIFEDAQPWFSPFSAPGEMALSFLETHQGSIFTRVQEIVDMMKLDGLESSLLAKAMETHPQLLLSTNDRSTWMLCNSYRVLLNILNILNTRNPSTITEADKRLLEENLKDAQCLGFDKYWLESVETKVFNFDISEVDDIQEVLEGLEDDLNTKKAMVAAVCGQEDEAEQEVDATQHKHANAIAQSRP